MKVNLSDGYEVTLDDNALDDWELLRDVVAAQGGDLTALVRAADRLLTPEENAKLLEHLRGANGRVSILAVANCIGQLLNGSPQTKNSASSQA